MLERELQSLRRLRSRGRDGLGFTETTRSQQVVRDLKAGDNAETLGEEHGKLDRTVPGNKIRAVRRKVSSRLKSLRAQRTGQGLLRFPGDVYAENGTHSASVHQAPATSLTLTGPCRQNTKQERLSLRCG